MSSKTFNGEQKLKLTQIINEGMQVLHEIETLNGGLTDTVKAVAEELIKSGKEFAGAFMDGFEETHAEKPVATAKPKSTAAKTAARKPSVRKPAAK